MWGLILGLCLVAVALGLRIDGKINDKTLIILLIAAGFGGFLIVSSGGIKKLKAGPSGIELETFQKEVNTVKAEAIDDIKKEVAIQEKAILILIDEANNTRQMLQKVADESRPPMLSLESKDIIRDGNDYIVKLEFKPSKNAPFAYLRFSAEIIGNSNAYIKLFNPYDVQLVYGNPGVISDDKKTATLWYFPIGTLWQKVMLRVSAPCTVRIASNYMSKELELEVK